MSGWSNNQRSIWGGLFHTVMRSQEGDLSLRSCMVRPYNQDLVFRAMHLTKQLLTTKQHSVNLPFQSLSANASIPPPPCHIWKLFHFTELLRLECITGNKNWSNLSSLEQDCSGPYPPGFWIYASIETTNLSAQTGPMSHYPYYWKKKPPSPTTSFLMFKYNSSIRSSYNNLVTVSSGLDQRPPQIIAIQNILWLYMWLCMRQ